MRTRAGIKGKKAGAANFRTILCTYDKNVTTFPIVIP